MAYRKSAKGFRRRVAKRGGTTRRSGGSRVTRRFIRSAVISRQLRYKAPTHFFKRYVNAASAVTTGNGSMQIGGVLAIGTTNHFVMQLSGTASTISFGAFAFAPMLADVPSVGDFTTLYDKYSLVGVKVRIIPYQNMSATGAAFTGSEGQSSLILHSIVDNDDNALPAATEAGVNALREYPSYRVQNMIRRPFKRYFRPHTLNSVISYSGTYQGNQVNRRSIYIDCSNTTVPHYGLKGIFEGFSGGSSTAQFNIFMKVEATYYLKLRDIR